MNILLVPSSYAPNVGGVEEMTRGLAAELRRAGHRVGVAASRWPASLPVREVLDGTEIRRFAFEMPARRASNILRFLSGFQGTIAGVSQFAKEIAADLVHVHCLGPNTLYGALAASKLGKPLVLTTHGELQDVDQRHSTSMRWVRNWALRRANWVTACSEFTLARAPIPPGVRASVVYNGLRPSVNPAVAQWPSERFAFCAARLTRNKGIDLAIEAFAHAAQTATDLRLHIAGDGPERAALEQLAHRLGIANRMRFLGMQPARVIDQLMQQCVFFVCPSRNEGFGLVNLEAMAAGKAVIATRAGGVPEIVEDEVNGLLVPPEDPEAMAEAMYRLITSQQLRQDLGEAGRRRAAEFTWKATAGQYLRIYEQVIHSRAVPAFVLGV